MRERGNKIPVIAKQDLFGGDVKKGENLFVQSILYTEEKVLHRGMGGYYRESSPENVSLGSLPKSLFDKPLGTVEKLPKSQYSTIDDNMVMVSCEPTIAPIGSYKDCVIITKEGREISGSALGMRRLQDVFAKV